MKHVFFAVCMVLLFEGMTAQDLAYGYIDIGNVMARIYPVGNQFGIPPVDTLHPLGYEVPKYSNKGSIHNCALWIGGVDQTGQLRFAGEKFRLNGADYWPGPVSGIYDSLYDVKWNRIWKISKAAIDDFKTNWTNPNYSIPQVILDWPAHGNTSLNQAYYLAPFADVDGNGNYNPQNGDFPLIRGDQALFFIFNDARYPHTESLGQNMGIEIHGMAYAFDCPGNPIWDNTIFLNYKIFNRSTISYSDVFAGIFTDFDIGYASDDYLGCDVANGFYYAYNGFVYDSIYGINPPVQAVQFIGGPFLNNDGTDNPKYNINNIQICNESINGLNFGDGIVDNERYGMNGFMSVLSNSPGVVWAITDPDSASDFMLFLKFIWKDNTMVQYGGNAHPSSASYGPECKFMFPGASDSCNWGTNGFPPNGPVYWTEETAANVPGNRRGLGRCGPFNLLSGASQEIDLAFIYARSDSGINASIDSIRIYAAKIKNAYVNNLVPCSGANISDTYYIVPEPKEIKVYPNPSNDIIYIDYGGIINISVCEIYNLMGDLIMTSLSSGTRLNRINIQSLQTGLYLLRISADGINTTLKFVKK